MGFLLRGGPTPLPAKKRSDHLPPSSASFLKTVLTSLKYAKYYMGVVWKNWSHPRNTYAQHGEDLLIESLLAPNSVKSFIDVGANDGVLFSNTYKFAKNGACGVCLEPSPPTFRKLRLNHLFHRKVKCIRAALSDNPGSLPFIHDGYEAVLSRVASPDCTPTSDAKSIEVPAITFPQLLDHHPSFRKVDLLSIDVEGHEKQVLEGLAEYPFQARLIVLETDKSEQNSLLSLTALQNYAPRYGNGVNLILAHKTQKLPVPTVLPPGFQKC
ncbi:MAG TPA: hypothetical protein DCG39_03780 [Opitutae bacterium]|nr:hypothetical protein [Opitutae bacterium]|tara:strand:- start:206 stop:1012 length:807 start_codon:yes stop_codon:yes gene_type:complete